MIVTSMDLLRTPAELSDYSDSMLTAISYAVPYAVVGAFLIVRRPDLPFGWLLAGTAVLAAAGSAASSLAYLAVSHGARPRLAIVGFALSGTFMLPVTVQGLINVRFPSGRISSRWGRILEIVLIIGIVLSFAGGALGDQKLTLVRADGTTQQLANPLTDGTTIGRIGADLAGLVPVLILLGLLAGLGVIRRAWKAKGIERYQLRWRAYGVVSNILLFPLGVSEALPLLVDLTDGLIFVTTLAIPVVRYRLWAIDTIIRRSAAYALVTIAVAGLFAGIAAGGTALAGERTGFVLAAAVAAVTFAPARGYSQRFVDRFFYGQRNDPYRALSDLGRQLATVGAPGEVLPGLVTAVASSLRLPYVAIERPGDGSVLASFGSLVPGERWPLSYQGETVGVLVAGPRRGEEAFDPPDRAVLTDIARQAGAAVHAEALTADLLVSRQRLVTAREEERRRLRRDLHDGLGPVLTGVGLTIDAARARHGVRAGDSTGSTGSTGSAGSAGSAGDQLGLLLGQAKQATTQALTDLRGIVYGLRPSALDDLGLAGAVAAHTQRLGEGGGVRVSLDTGQVGDRPLPAAVEVAAFRIAVEAVNNVVRHSGARTCRVRLSVDDPGQLLVEVSDDGPGRGPWSAGVGMAAMRERAAELGGTLTAGPATGVGDGPGGGTVRACLPLPALALPAGSAASVGPAAPAALAGEAG